MSRTTFAEINLTALSNNFAKLVALAPNSNPIAVVKADAYGNGAIPVAKKLENQVAMFAVAILSEAIALRDAGLVKPILILQGPLTEDELVNTEQHNFHWMLHNKTQLQWFRCANQSQSLNGHQWLKFDTGMHRLGFMPEQLSWIQQSYPDVYTNEAVIATHLACADTEGSDHTQKQLIQFKQLIEDLTNPVSIVNSAGLITLEGVRKTYSRIGIAAYGSSPFKEAGRFDLEPVMTFSAPIIAVREIPAGDSVGYGANWTAERNSIIATVAAGYADGYPRHAPNGTPAWLNGQVMPLAGRVSMDMITFDITDLSNVQIGDQVELWGANNPINNVAECVDTIGYELMTRVSQRVPRRYVE